MKYTICILTLLTLFATTACDKTTSGRSEMSIDPISSASIQKVIELRNEVTRGTHDLDRQFSEVSMLLPNELIHNSAGLDKDKVSAAVGKYFMVVETRNMFNEELSNYQDRVLGSVASDKRDEEFMKEVTQYTEELRKHSERYKEAMIQYAMSINDLGIQSPIYDQLMAAPMHGDQPNGEGEQMQPMQPAQPNGAPMVQPAK